MNIIGLNAFHGDSSACLIQDGKIVAAAEEERFRRIKHWAGFPSKAIEFCLQEGGLVLGDIDVVAINSDNKAARNEKLKFLLTGQASVSLIKEKISLRKKRQSIQEHFAENFAGQTFNAKIETIEHHEAHLASAFYVSPFKNAVVVSVDGFGDFCSAAWGIGQGDSIDIKKRVYFPHSLGIFYSALTQYLGFPHYGDEYKIMGLAPYGSNQFANEMNQIVLHEQDGGFKLNTKFFKHHKEPIAYQWDDGIPAIAPLFTDKLDELLGTRRQKGEELTQRHKDIAHSIQNAYERAFFNLINHAQGETLLGDIAVAGGCGMNSVANGKIATQSKYTRSYIQAAAGDAGGAIGAALVAAKRHGLSPRVSMSHAYLGKSSTATEISKAIDQNKQAFNEQACVITKTTSEQDMYSQTVDCMLAGGVVGWFQGAMEWGPRALGNRSIICDPRRPDMKDIINSKIKRRESFRPFAPSILREHVSDWFEIDDDVPFMMKVFPIKQEKRDSLPAVTHADGSGRLQTVTEASNARYYGLIKHFFKKTGVPLILNTSFNENEPIVCVPEEAIACFLRTDMDMLVMDDIIIQRPQR